VAGRSTKAEKDFRIATVYGLLCEGSSRAQIIQYAADNWEISERAADNYIAWARQHIAEDCNMSRQAFLAESVVGLRQIRQAAQKRGQHQVALNAIRLQAELIGGIGKATA
jgi:hypothetical protein